MTTERDRPAAMARVCDLRRHGVIGKPFPHVVNEAFIASPLFEQLRDSFPTCLPTTGPTGFSLYWEDPAYQRLLDENPAWRVVADVFHGQHFIDWAIEQFGEVWQRDKCRVNLSRARFVPYHEDRIDKERPALRTVDHGPDELWVRMDIHQGQVGYGRVVHRDHPRRLISMLVYLCDGDAIGMAGGDLQLHASPWQRWLRPAITIAPRENLMVAFPCTDRSYHSVASITSMARPRNYLQIQISSSIDVWPRGNALAR